MQVQSVFFQKQVSWDTNYISQTLFCPKNHIGETIGKLEKIKMQCTETKLSTDRRH